MDAAADLADRFSHGELRVTHDQNLLLPWVREADLLALWQAARDGRLRHAEHRPAHRHDRLPRRRLLRAGQRALDPGRRRRSPSASPTSTSCYDIGDIDLHISGCINSCGHHHSGHIGILGVDKDGSEWYQVTLGGSDGSHAQRRRPVPGKVIGPSFAADEVADVIEAVIDTYRAQRAAGERFIDTVRRVGLEPFKGAANAVRRSTARRGLHASTARRPMRFIDTHQRSAGTPLGGEDGPTVTHHAEPAPAARPRRSGMRRAQPLAGGDCRWACMLANDSDVESIAADLPRLALVALQFPKWTDGRAYSQARAAALALPLSRARCAPPARCWSTCCRCSQRTGFDAVVLRADQSARGGRARARLLPRPLPGRRRRAPAAVRQRRHRRRTGDGPATSS